MSNDWYRTTMNIQAAAKIIGMIEGGMLTYCYLSDEELKQMWQALSHCKVIRDETRPSFQTGSNRTITFVCEKMKRSSFGALTTASWMRGKADNWMAFTARKVYDGNWEVKKHDPSIWYKDNWDFYGEYPKDIRGEN